MARQRPHSTAHLGGIDPSVALSGNEAGAVRVLVVTGRGSVQRRIGSMLHARVESVTMADTADEARGRINTERYDLLIVEQALGGMDGIELLDELTTLHPTSVAVVIGKAVDTDDAVRAMRCGACDLISMNDKPAEIQRRLIDACKRAERVRQRDARVDRLKKLCHKLNNARQEVSGQIGGLCTDLVDAYRDLSEQFGDVQLSSELNSLLRQELEIESLLRTLLEFTLAKIGSTNAVVFLPTNSGDYSLGAYVNYDVPKDSAEMMLDQLADSLAPAFEGCQTVTALNGLADMQQVLGPEAHWLENSTVMVVGCQEDDECLAVFALFRDRSRPFSEDDVRTLGIIAELFGNQLGRVINIHHRHIPRDEWGMLDDPSCDDGFDLDDEFGGDGYGFAA